MASRTLGSAVMPPCMFIHPYVSRGTGSRMRLKWPFFLTCSTSAESDRQVDVPGQEFVPTAAVVLLHAQKDHSGRSLSKAQ